MRIVSQDTMSEVMKIYPPLKFRVFVDDITALVKEKRSGGNGKEGDEEAERGSGEKKASNCQSRTMARKEQDDCVVWFPGE